MSSMTASLLWKEYRERKWPFVLGTAWMVFGALYAILYETTYRLRAPIASYSSICMFYGLFVPIFLAMRTSLGEVTHGSLGFSRGLPVSLRRIAWIRVLGAVACLVGPILIGTILMSLAAGTGLIEQAQRRATDPHAYVRLPERASMSPGEAVGFLWTAAAIACASAVELLLILCVIGARRRAESHIGFIGAIVAFAWILGGAPPSQDSGWWTWWVTLLPQGLATHYGYGLENGLSYTDLVIHGVVWGPLAGNLVLLVALVCWFTRRYGTRDEARAVLPRRRSWRPGVPSLLSRVPFRWPGRTAALVWLDLRQAVPMALCGLALAVVWTTSEIGMRSLEVYEDVFPHPSLGLTPQAIAGSLPGAMWIVGAFWAAVVGAGVFAAELRPNLEQFWRSRPISPPCWFWVKFTCGLLAVLIVLDLVAIIAGQRYAPFAPDPTRRISMAYVACFPLLHAWMYALAVAGVCWLRRPVWGAMCAIAMMFAIGIVTGSVPGWGAYEPVQVYNMLNSDEQRGQLDLWKHGYPLVYLLLAATTAGCAVVACRAVSRSTSSRETECRG